MYKRLLFLILIINTTTVRAQYSSGLTTGANYSQLSERNNVEEEYPGIGFSVGYKWMLHVNPKWELSMGALLNVHNTIIKTGSVQTNIKSPYAVLPICIGYDLTPKWNLLTGYQFGYLLVDDMSTANPRDHAALLGFSYNFGFMRTLLYYQQSLNQISTTYTAHTYHTDENGNNVITNQYSYEYKRNKISAIFLTVYIPMNRKKEKEDE